MLDGMYVFENVSISSVDIGENITLEGELSYKVPVCTSCGSISKQFINKYDTLRYRDWNLGDKRVYLRLKTSWYKCGICGRSYRASSNDLGVNNRFTKRMLEYIGKLGVTETYNTLSTIYGISNSTVDNIYKLYIKNKMFDRQGNVYKEIIIGHSIIKDVRCCWVAKISPFEILSVIPDCRIDDLRILLSKWYTNGAPDVVYCSLDSKIIELIKELFKNTKIIIDMVAFRNMILSVANIYRTKAKVKCDVENIFNDISKMHIRPHDESFLLKCAWLKTLYEYATSDVNDFRVRKHLEKGRNIMKSIIMNQFDVLEKYPELLHLPEMNKYDKETYEMYVKFLDKLNNTQRCKSLGRAIQKLINVDDFGKLHKPRIVENEVCSEKGTYELFKLWNSESFSHLNEFERLELLKNIDEDLYYLAIHMF